MFTSSQDPWRIFLADPEVVKSLPQGLIGGGGEGTENLLEPSANKVSGGQTPSSHPSLGTS